MTPARFSAVLLCVAISSACAKPVADAPPPPGLAFELSFESTCEPAIATGLATQLPASGIDFVEGVEGRAVEIDGSGVEMKYRGLDALKIRDSMTLEFFVSAPQWINPYGAGSGLESMVSHSTSFTVAFDPRSRVLSARVTTTAAEESRKLEGGKLTPDEWHHVALVVDGANGTARLMLDGNVVCEESVRGDVVIKNGLDLVVGTWFAKNQAFYGTLDSIRIWNRALAADELKARAALARRSNGSGAMAPGS